MSKQTSTRGKVSSVTPIKRTSKTGQSTNAKSAVKPPAKKSVWEKVDSLKPQRSGYNPSKNPRSL
jgi:hypothetical protein